MSDRRIQIDRYLPIWRSAHGLFGSDSFKGSIGQKMPDSLLEHIADWRDEWELQGVFDREHKQIIEADEVMPLVDELVREARAQAEAERAQPYSWR